MQNEMEKINSDTLPEKTQTKFKEFFSFQFLFKHKYKMGRKFLQTREDEIKSKEYISLKRELDLEVKKIIGDEDQAKLILYLEKGYRFPDNSVQSFLGIIQNSDSFQSPIIKEFLTKKHMPDINEYFLDELNMMSENSSSTVQAKFIFSLLPNIIEKLHKTISYFKIDVFFNDPEKSLVFLDNFKKVKRVINKYKMYDIGVGEELIKELIKKFDPFIFYIETTHKEAIEKKLDETINYFHNVLQDFNAMKETISVDVLSNIRKFNEKDLPEPSRKVIQEIKIIYNEISTDKLNVKQTLDLDNLYKKRFPQLLEEYITISPRYREKLQLHDENPDRLLLESLVDIKTKINVIFEQLQENNVNKLKVTSKYLKNV